MTETKTYRNAETRIEIARHLTDGQRWGVAIFQHDNGEFEVATVNSVNGKLTSLTLSWHKDEATARKAANTEVAHQRAHLREQNLPVH